jgi:hypothetical protein
LLGTEGVFEGLNLKEAFSLRKSLIVAVLYQTERKLLALKKHGEARSFLHLIIL